MISTLRSQVGFAAAVAHARLRLLASRLSKGLSNSLGVPPDALRVSSARLHFAFEQARGGAARALRCALGAGWGRAGFARCATTSRL